MSQASTLLMDTTVLIDVLRNRNDRRRLLASLVLSGQELATSAICVAEVYGGMRRGEEVATRALLAGIEQIPVSAAIGERAGNLKADFRRLGQTRSIADMIVAGTALERGCALATDNQKDFQVPGLSLFPLP